MTPEERAAVIMANMATVPCGSDRWNRLVEMVEHQFKAAIREERERLTVIGYGIVRDFWSEQEAARFRDEFAIRSRTDGETR